MKNFFLNFNITLFWIFLLAFNSAGANSSERYDLIPWGSHHLFSESFHFSIGYGLNIGIHQGHAEEAQGSLVFSPENGQISEANFSLPIKGLRTGNEERDCHMREALGLNYEQSDFPEKHVCDNQNFLPSHGPNSIQYPQMVFTLTKAEIISGSLGELGESEEGENLRSSRTAVFQVTGVWEIHGKRKEKTHTMQVRVLGDDHRRMEIEGDFSLLLSDFDIFVKPAVILGVSVGVENEVQGKIKLALARKENLGHR